MNNPRAFFNVLLLLGASTSLWAQRQIVETAPGARSPGVTNAVAPSLPEGERGGGILDRIYRPNSVQLPPLDLGPSGGSSGAKLDPAVEKRLKEERNRKKNWAVEGAARLNRGETGVGERRRSDADGRRSSLEGRPPTAAEIQLQAVDPKFAREQKKKSGGSAEAAADRAAELEERKHAGKDPITLKDLNHPQDATDVVETSAELASKDRQRRSESKDRWDKVLDDKSKPDENRERTISEVGLDLSRKENGVSLESLDSARELVQQQREREFSNLIGDSAAGLPTTSRTESFLGGGPATRSVEFQKLLVQEPVATPTARLGLDPSASISSGAAVPSLGASRELPGISSAAGGFNFSSGQSAPTFAPPPTRLAPLPVQLPAPVRGKNGF